MPSLLWRIDDYNKGADTKINVKGMMIGNGVTNWTYDTLPASIGFSYWHALTDDVFNDNVTAHGCDFSGLNFGRFPSKACLELYAEFQNLTSMLDMYNIFKPVYGPTGNMMDIYPETANLPRKLQMFPTPAEYAKQEAAEKKKKFGHTQYTPWMISKEHSKPNVYVGILTSPIDYLNDKDVQTALHIPDDTPPWTECSDYGTGFEYIMEERAS
jgi:hypothetical protein